MYKNHFSLKSCISYFTRVQFKSQANSSPPLKRTEEQILVYLSRLLRFTQKSMSGWVGSLTVIFLVSSVIIACSATNTPQNQSSDPTNPTATANRESVQKVVTLNSLTTDIIYQLDKTKLVGIPSSQLTNNNPRFKDLPSVSSERTPPNLEKIVALKPDLVIGSAGFHNQTMEKLNQLGIKTLLTQVTTWKALEELTENLARSLNANPEPLLKRYQSFLADISNQNLSTLVLVSRQPILSPNKDSWAGDLITQFKFKNVSAQLQGNNPIQGYVTLSAEKILEANPDLIFLVDRGDGILDKFKSDSFWKQLKAVQNNRVYVFDYYGFVNPGSIDSIEKTCSQLRQILNTKV